MINTKTQEEVNDEVLNYINRVGFCTLDNILNAFFADDIQTPKLQRSLSELTMDKKIHRLEYILPDSHDRKAIYFPYGTKID